MKIAVYGDSYSVANWQCDKIAWYNILAEKLGGTVYDEKGLIRAGIGAGGRPVFLSYKNFLKYHKNYDFNIFVVGDPYRYTKQYSLNNHEFYATNLNTVDYLLAQGEIDKKEAEYLTGWFLKTDYDFLNTAHELMLQDIERHDPKVLMIPSHRKGTAIDGTIGSFNEERMKRLNMDFGLTDLVRTQLDCLGAAPDWYWKTENPERICCHFTEETNAWLANELFDYIKHNKKLELPKYIHHTKDYKYYYE